jgi:hypothetical protein
MKTITLVVLFVLVLAIAVIGVLWDGTRQGSSKAKLLGALLAAAGITYVGFFVQWLHLAGVGAYKL